MKTFKNFQGETIRINGTCYQYIGGLTGVPNSDPSEIDAFYVSCLECELDESSSFSSSSNSSESFGNTSSSTSSMSSESIGNVSSSSSDGVIIEDCVGPCNLEVQFKTFNIPDGLKVYDGTGLILDTGLISTGSNFNTYSFTNLECPIRVCINAPNIGTGWALKVNGCGMNIDTTGGQANEICYESPALQSSESSSSEGIRCDCCPAIEATISGITGTCSDSNGTWIFVSDPFGDPCYWEAIEPSTSGYITKDPTTNEWIMVINNSFKFFATTSKTECVPSSWVLVSNAGVCSPYGSPSASTVCTDPRSSSSISLSEESESVGGVSDSSSSFGLDCVDGEIIDVIGVGGNNVLFSTGDTSLFEVGDLVSLIVEEGPCAGTYTGEVGEININSSVTVTSLSPQFLCNNPPYLASLCFIEDLSSSSSDSSQGYSESSSLGYSDSSSSESGGPSFPATTDPQIILTLTFGGGGTKRLSGIDFESGVPQAVQPTFYDRPGFPNTGERWFRQSESHTMKFSAIGESPYNFELLGVTSQFGFGAFFFRRSASSLNPLGGGVSNGIVVTGTQAPNIPKVGTGRVVTHPQYTVSDEWFGPGGSGGTITVNAGPFAGVTFKWERGPDGTGLNKEWKANLP